MRLRPLIVAACVTIWCGAAVQPAAAQSDGSFAALGGFAAASASGDTATAANLARALLPLDASALGLSDEEGLELKAQLADALAAAGDAAGAAGVYEDILADQERLFGAGAIELVDTLETLASLKSEIGDGAAAAALADRAIDIVEIELGDDHPRLTSLLGLRAGLPGAPADIGARLAAVSSGDDAAPEAPAFGTRSLASGPSASASTDGDFNLVKVFYGTSRARSDRDGPTDVYSGERRAAGEDFDTGVITVSVPKNREVGSVPEPSIWRGEFRPNPSRHLFIKDLERFPDHAEFARQLREAIDRSDRREAFVYIHGYSNDFDSAALRTAQLAADLEIDGAPLFYSWPSKGGVMGYVADGAQVVRPVVQDLETFLTLIATEAGAERLHLVAHSMGNRYLVEALELMVADAPAGDDKMFDDVIFAAPDVDAEDFAARLTAIEPLADRFTLYASSQDRAMQLSKMINGGYQRAGDASDPLIMEGLDTVDTSSAPSDSDTVRHSDAFDQAIDDFRSIIWFSLGPENRCLLTPQESESSDGVVWVYQTAASGCDPALYSEAITMLRRLGRDRALQLLDNQARVADDAPAVARVNGLRQIIAWIQL